MCAIFGILSKEKIQKKELEHISSLLSHRGPDDWGQVEFLLGNKILTLLHRRLSIIDLSDKAHQPMSDEQGKLWIVYNGEVYNFREIREELVKKGYKFRSNSDTEVVLYSYKEWGSDCVNKFIGMFAFCIFDKERNKLILARDHAGIKPLYYYCCDGNFMFSSELKSFMCIPQFKKNIDPEGLYLYLLLGYIPSPFCIFKNTYKLEAGHTLEVDLDTLALRKSRWWHPAYTLNVSWKKMLFKETKEILKEKLLDAFRYRLVADVPVGVFLSGGIDSTLITVLLQKNLKRPLKTFTIGFYEKDYDEALWAKKIAQFLGTEHQEFFCTPQEAFEVIKIFPRIYDEPFADSSGIPTYLVSKFARNFVKVCLSGDGGDELFGGYDRYTKMLYQSRLLHIPYRIRDSIATAFLKFYHKNTWAFKRISEDKIYKFFSLAKSKGLFEGYISHISYWNPLQLTRVMKQAPYSVGLQEFLYPEMSLREKMMLWDFMYYLEGDLLTKVDRSSMSNSLEARVPILDKRVCSFSLNLPLHYKFKKRIIKSILSDYLPSRLFMRPKRGFGVPIHNWFKSELKELFSDYLSKSMLNKSGFLNADYIIDCLNRYLKNGNVSVHKLWAILVFQMWYEEWMRN